MKSKADKQQSARKRKRWHSYSLRSFLFLTSLAAVVIGCWVSLMQPMQRQWEAVDRFEALGATVESTPSNLPWRVKLFLVEDRNENVTMNQLPSKGHTGSISETMKGLKHLPVSYTHLTLPTKA